MSPAVVPADSSAPAPSAPIRLNSPTHRFYRRVLRELGAAGIDFLVGGGYALERHLGIGRPVKDLDLFMRSDDVPRAFDRLRSRMSCETELTFPHWLGKIVRRNDHVDVIFNSGNGLCPVDDEWFRHAVPSQVLGVPVSLCPVEEMIWSKAFVMERERYDGADVAHLLHACAGTLDWTRLTRRFGPHWRVLFTHLTLFGFIYPSERRRIPETVMRRCLTLLEHEMRTAPPRRICRGTLTSRAQYLVDVELWGYEDARVGPHGTMTDEETSIWTAAIDTDVSRPLAELPRPEPSDDSPSGGNHHGSM
jgi:Nucleotidyl transferase of unknown function (DUF2204)